MGHSAEKSPEELSVHKAFEAVPSNRIAEIINGALHTFPRPAPRHAKSSSGLGVLIGGPFGYGLNGPGGWLILDEPELHLGPDLLVPDLAGWRSERMPHLPETTYFALSPNWVCEVLSPSTEALDRSEKMSIYAREGVQHLWFVDPGIQTLEVFELNAVGLWTVLKVHRGNELVRARPFDAVELNLALLWG